MKYGDPVVLVIGDATVLGIVLQSLSHPIADKEGNFIKDKDGNFSPNCEHLTVAYAEPTDKPQILGGQQVTGAIKFLYSVTPWQEGQHIGFRNDLVVEAIRKAGTGEDAKPVQEPASEQTDETIAKYEEDDLVIGCKVGVEISTHLVTVTIGGRDHSWSRDTGEHVGSGVLLGEPLPVVSKEPYSAPLASASVPATTEAPAHVPATAEEVHAQHESLGEKIKDGLKDAADGLGNAVGEAFTSR